MKNELVLKIYADTEEDVESLIKQIKEKYTVHRTAPLLETGNDPMKRGIYYTFAVVILGGSD